MFNREAALEIYSDLHKDAYGYRPGYSPVNLSDEAIQKDLAHFQHRIETDIAEERKREELAVAKWDLHISTVMKDHGICWADAVRWDMQAMSEEDVGQYCWEQGLPYRMEREICGVLG